jgi:hypothetical protein
VAGPAIFVALAAASAMLAFFSSAALVPAGVVAWGMPTTAALLSLGWLLGGLLSYGSARGLGRPLLAHLAPVEFLAKYERRVSRDTPFGVVLLFQLALPSEIRATSWGSRAIHWRATWRRSPSWRRRTRRSPCGSARSFLQRRLAPLLAVLAAGALVGAVALHLLRRHLDRAHPR